MNIKPTPTKENKFRRKEDLFVINKFAWADINILRWKHSYVIDYFILSADITMAEVYQIMNCKDIY